jgi:iron complex outermembrane receptor protein
MLHIRSCVKLFSTLIIIVLSATAYTKADDCLAVVSGFLHNQQHEPITGAIVYLKEIKKNAATNEQGAYRLEKVCAGTYTLVCQAVGFKTLALKVEVQSNGSIHYDIALEDDAIHLQEVQIKALPTTSERMATQSISMLNEAEISRQTGKNLGDLLKNIVGVNTLQTGATISKPVIHGLHSNRILILNNGIRHEGQQWGNEHAPEIDPLLTAELVVMKGASAVRYGADAIGGVILVEPAALPTAPTLSGRINIAGATNNGLGITSGQLQGNLKGLFGWRVQSTYKIAGDSRAAKYVLSNTGLREWNFSGALGLKKTNYGAEVFYSRFSTDLGILRAAHTGNLEDLERAIASDRPWYIADFTYQIDNPRQAIVHSLLKAKTYWNTPQTGKLSLQYGYQLNNRQEYDLRRGGRSDRAALDMTLHTHTLDLAWEQPQMRSWRGSVGVQGLFQANSNASDTGIRPLIPQYQRNGLGIFLIERWVKTKYELEAGLRYDFQDLAVQRYDRQNNLLKPEHSFQNLSGTIGTVYFINPSLTLRSNLATAWRPPNVAELYSEGLHHGAGSIEEGRDNLQTEKAIKWINTLTYNTISNEKAKKGIAIEGSIYYNSIQNYIFLEPREVRLTIRGAFPVLQYNQTQATFWGVDYAMQWFFVENVALKAKASLVRAKDTRSNDYLPWIPADSYEVGLGYDKEQFGKVKDFYIGINTQINSRQNRALRVFSITEIRTLQANEGELPEYTFDYTEAPEGYILLNFKAGFGIPIQENTLSFNLTIDNIFNTDYRNYMNRFRYFAADVGRNVTVGVNYQF